MDGLIPLVRRLEAAVDVYNAAGNGTAEHALARDEVTEIRRRIAALPIDHEAVTSALLTVEPLVLPPPPHAAPGWRRPRFATFARR